VEAARGAIRALGYDLESVYADLEPEVRAPAKLRGKWYVLYQIRWFKPNLEDRQIAEVQVNGATGEIEELSLLEPATWRPDPALAVEPVIKLNAVQREKLSDADKKELLALGLPHIESLTAKLGLPLARPVTAGQVSEIKGRRYVSRVRSEVWATLVLSNGYQFTFNASQLEGFAAPGVFFGSQPVRVKDFVGPWKLSKRQATALARDTVKRLGLPERLFSTRRAPKVNTPFLRGPALVPRYAFTWEHEPSSSEVCVEVDAEHGRVTAVNLTSGVNWQKSWAPAPVAP
jgi:hypothetical protein